MYGSVSVCLSVCLSVESVCPRCICFLACLLASSLRSRSSSRGNTRPTPDAPTFGTTLGRLIRDSEMVLGSRPRSETPSTSDLLYAAAGALVALLCRVRQGNDSFRGPPESILSPGLSTLRCLPSSPHWRGEEGARGGERPGCRPASMCLLLMLARTGLLGPSCALSSLTSDPVPWSIRYGRLASGLTRQLLLIHGSTTFGATVCAPVGRGEGGVCVCVADAGAKRTRCPDREYVLIVHDGGVQCVCVCICVCEHERAAAAPPPPPSAVSSNFPFQAPECAWPDSSGRCCIHTAFQFWSEGEGGGAGGDGRPFRGLRRAVPGCRTPYVQGMATPAVHFTACAKATAYSGGQSGRGRGHVCCLLPQPREKLEAQSILSTLSTYAPYYNLYVCTYKLYPPPLPPSPQGSSQVW